MIPTFVKLVAMRDCSRSCDSHTENNDDQGHQHQCYQSPQHRTCLEEGERERVCVGGREWFIAVLAFYKEKINFANIIFADGLRLPTFLVLWYIFRTLNDSSNPRNLVHKIFT